MKAVTIAAAEGIGNIIMATPLVSAMKDLGFRTFFWMDPTPEGTQVANLFHNWNADKVSQRDPRPFIEDSEAILVTYWARMKFEGYEIDPRFRFSRIFFPLESEVDQNMALAHSIGYKGPTPPTWVSPSNAKFGLPKDSVIVHPGCKRSWQDRKSWGKFSDLIDYLKNPIILLGPEDVFHVKHGGRNPSTAHNLKLPDAAALIREAGSFIGNDAGPMHIAMAVGALTFGVFGPTPIEKSYHPQAQLVPITNEIPCRHYCNFYDPPVEKCKRRCLDDLTVEMVLEEIKSFAPELLR